MANLTAGLAGFQKERGLAIASELSRIFFERKGWLEGIQGQPLDLVRRQAQESADALQQTILELAVLLNSVNVGSLLPTQEPLRS
jgi:hypothetical protein